MSCFQKHDISYTYPAENRATFCANGMKCVENLALSYRFPACKKFKFFSSVHYSKDTTEMRKSPLIRIPYDVPTTLIEKCSKVLLTKNEDTSFNLDTGVRNGGVPQYTIRIVCQSTNPAPHYYSHLVHDLSGKLHRSVANFD